MPAGCSIYIDAVRIQVDVQKAAHPVFWQCPSADVVSDPFMGAKRTIGDFPGLVGGADASREMPLVAPEKTDLWFSATADGGGGGVTASYSGILVNDSYFE